MSMDIILTVHFVMYLNKNICTFMFTGKLSTIFLDCILLSTILSNLMLRYK